MGNHTGKDSHGSAGSPLDFFQTPPTTPTEAALNAMASQASSDSATPETAACTTPFTHTSPLSDWAHKLSAPSEWAVISVDSITSSRTNVSDGTTAALDSPIRAPTSRGSSSEQSWQERDSGLEPQASVERASEEMTLVLLSLMEHYQGSLGLAPNPDLASGAVELLRHLITERDELSEEVRTLREILRREREDWQQFQCDLQVAVSVADRLKLESETALDSLQQKYKALDQQYKALELQLGQTLTREQVKDGELENLKAEHKEVCHKLSELTLQQQHATKDTSVSESERRGCGETLMDNEGNQILQDDAVVPNPENLNEGGSVCLTGKGVAECYLRSLATLEKKRERVNILRDSRRIVMLSERSWSLSRLPLPAEVFSETQINTSTTLPLCKKVETSKGRRMDRVLQQQDSWSSFYTEAGKREEDSDSVKPQDGFSALLRRHGGSRRNSLLHWCQERTQGYENIDLTNFSSSWEDGLALCALYHTYLPGDIPYGDLKPVNKSENLDLALRTGERLGIPSMLTVEDMLKVDGPDWQKVLSYVESIFRHFEM